MQDMQKPILALFIELELKLAELYHFFAETFAEESDFFRTHYSEELKHAQWIDYFRDKIAQGSVLFLNEKMHKNTLASFLTHVQTVLDDAKSSKLTILQALSLAVSIEESLIERKVFEHFQTNSSEFRRILMRLKDETAKHAAEMKKTKLKYSAAKT